MGMDSVELVMAIEEAFGVAIEDEVAEKMVTVGDVFEWLKVRLAAYDPNVCLTQQIFYKLRRALVENYSLSRDSMVLEAKLCDFMTAAEVESGWPFLQMFIDLKTPPFRDIQHLFSKAYRKDTWTIRDLVQSLIEVNKLPTQTSSPSEIWSRLVIVFVNVLNVNPDQVVAHASITRDLGCD